MSPLGVVQQDQHAGAAVVLETLVVVAVGVPDQIVEHGRVDDVQQPRPGVVRGHLLHGFAVAFVILPSARWSKRWPQWKLLDIPCISHFVTTASPSMVSEGETVTV